MRSFHLKQKSYVIISGSYSIHVPKWEREIGRIFRLSGDRELMAY